jgi:aminomethyltransferase
MPALYSRPRGIRDETGVDHRRGTTVAPVSESTLKQTPLHDRHLAAGAKTADFGGWDMPIEYTGVVAEHTAVRTAVGLFDVSHMGKVRVHGPGSVAFLNSLLANDLDRIADGHAQYSMLCTESGGVVDDLIVYRWAQDEVFIIPNASNAASVVAVLVAAAPAEVVVEDHHLDHGIIAVQGPRSAELIAAMGLPADHEYMAMASAEYHGAPVIVCRTGYTGEHGYEIVAPVAVLGDLWDELLDVGAPFGAVPAGLGARDTLRTEMGYPLHGQDISPKITPVEAMIGWAVGWDKPAFSGREALLAQRAAGPGRRLRGLLALDRGIPRPHMAVRRIAADEAAPLDGAAVGEVTSGTFSPTLKQGVGLALLDASVSVGDEVVVDVRGRASRFRVVKPPFVEASTR